MSSLFGLTEKQLNLIREALSRFNNVDDIIVFGSRAMGNYKNGSDVDLAVKGKNVTTDTISKLSATLNEELPLPYFFDIVHYDTLNNKNFVRHIDEHGVPLEYKICNSI